MSLKNSLDKLNAAMSVNNKKKDCCVKFNGVGTDNPTVTEYCNGNFSRIIPDLKVPADAKLCPETET